MLFYKHHWDNVPEYFLSPEFKPATKISVIIAARNEENNISECLESIAVQDYPMDLYEVLLIDDFSTDGTHQKVQKIAERYTHIHYHSLSDFKQEHEIVAHKKTAIEYGISLAQNDLIVCTDADCVAPHTWLSMIADFYQTQQPQFIAAPVLYHREKNIFEKFQSLDVCATMGITAASIRSKVSYMSNGANLAYPKAIFEELQGFEGLKEKASGDDIMFIYKVAKQYPDGVRFLLSNDAAIKTYANRTLKKFSQQRLRWATKNADLQDRSIPWILASVLAFNCLLLFGSIYSIFMAHNILGLIAFVWLAKMVVDFVFLYTTSEFFFKKQLLRYYFVFEVFHLLYIVIIGITANLVKNYTWKDRKLK